MVLATYTRPSHDNMPLEYLQLIKDGLFLLIATILGGVFTYLNTRTKSKSEEKIAHEAQEGRFYDQILEFADQTREDIAGLKQENLELRQENKKLREENSELKKEVRDIRIAFADLKEDRAKRANEIIKLEYEVRTLKQELAKYGNT